MTIWNRKIVGAMMLVFLLVSFTTSQVNATSNIALSWGPWTCQSLANVSVPGGTMTSRNCYQYEDSSFAWAESSDTFGPLAYSITTNVWGYDRCHTTDPWVNEMSTGSSSLNATSNTSGRAQGSYLDCSVVSNPNHQYQDYSQHDWQQTYGGTIYSRTGYAYH